MNDGDRFTSIISKLQESASVESVYGDPVESNGKTVIPVSKIIYGFGGGYGADSDSEDQSTENEDRTTEDENQGGMGAGMGGSVIAIPSGVVEITDSETRFIPIGSNRKLAAVALACFGLGYVLGRIRSFGD